LRFCGVHLSADQDGDCTQQRIEDCQLITSSSFEKHGKLLDHDLIIIGGDFNFRINLERTHIHELATKKEFNSLLLYDQQTMAKNDSKILQNFKENKIIFPPTYKYIIGSTEYNLTEPVSKRNPAYTDRIIYYEKQDKLFTVHQYEAGSMMESDHRPIFLTGSF